MDIGRLNGQTNSLISPSEASDMGECAVGQKWDIPHHHHQGSAVLSCHRVQRKHNKPLIISKRAVYWQLCGARHHQHHRIHAGLHRESLSSTFTPCLDKLGWVKCWLIIQATPKPTTGMRPKLDHIWAQDHRPLP